MYIYIHFYVLKMKKSESAKAALINFMIISICV